MPIKEVLRKNKKNPVTIIVNGANELGKTLARLLMDQGGFVLLIDEYNSNSSSIIEEFKTKELFGFLDISSLEELKNGLYRLDYMFYMSHDKTNLESNVSSKDFLDTSNNINIAMKLCLDYKAKFLLATSLHANQILRAKRDYESNFNVDEEDFGYTNLEIQRYSENLTNEYMKQSGLDGRIVRIGEIFGEKVELRQDSKLSEFIKVSLGGKKIKIFGDGLEQQYFIYLSDAAYGLIKAMFTKSTQGRVFSLTNTEEVTTLTLAYKIVDLMPRTKGIDFLDEKEGRRDLSLYKPAPNLTDIGWKQKVPFERGLALTINHTLDINNMNKRDDLKIHRNESSSNKNRQKGLMKKAKGLFSKKSDIKDKKDKETVSVLDTLMRENLAVAKSNENKVHKKKNINKSSSKNDKSDKPIFHKGKLQKESGKTIAGSAKKITTRKVFVLILLLVPLSILYLKAFVPAIQITYQYIRLNNSLSKGLTAFHELNINENKERISEINESYEKIEKAVSELKWARKLIGDARYNQIASFAINGSEMSENTIMLLEKLSPLEKYKQEYVSNLAYNNSSDTVVLRDTPIQYQYLESIADSKSSIEFYLTNISSSLDILEKNDGIPLINNSKLQNNFNNYYAWTDVLIGSSNVLINMDYVFGLSDEQSVLVVLKDEQFMNPSGGRSLAYGLYTISNGNFIRYENGSSDNIGKNISLTEISELRKNISDTYGFTYTGDDMEILDYVLSDTRRKEEIYKIASDHFETNIGTIITLDLGSVGKILDLIGDISLDNEGFVDSSNISDKIEYYGNEDTNSEFLDKTILKLAELGRSDFMKLISEIKSSVENNGMRIDTQDVDFSRMLSESKINLDGTGYEGSYFNIFFTTFSKQESNSFEADIDIIENIYEDGDIGETVQIDFETLSDGFDGFLIIKSSSDQMLSGYEITPDSTIKKVSETDETIVFRVNLQSDEKGLITTEFDTSVAQSTDMMYNHSLFIENIPGNSALNLKIYPPEFYSFNLIDGDLIVSDTEAFWSGNITNPKEFELQLIKE